MATVNQGIKINAAVGSTFGGAGPGTVGFYTSPANTFTIIRTALRLPTSSSGATISVGGVNVYTAQNVGGTVLASSGIQTTTSVNFFIDGPVLYVGPGQTCQVVVTGSAIDFQFSGTQFINF